MRCGLSAGLTRHGYGNRKWLIIMELFGWHAACEATGMEIRPSNIAIEDLAGLVLLLLVMLVVGIDLL